MSTKQSTRVRRSFTLEFKRDAVRLVREGKAHGTSPAVGNEGANATEIAALKKCLRDAEEERDTMNKGRRCPASRTTRSEVPVRPGVPGGLPGRHDVSRSEGLPQWLLRMATSPTEASRTRGSGARGSDPRGPCPESRDRRVPSYPRRTPARRNSRRPQVSGSPDALGGPLGLLQATVPTHGHGQCARRAPRRPEPSPMETFTPTYPLVHGSATSSPITRDGSSSYRPSIAPSKAVNLEQGSFITPTGEATSAPSTKDASINTACTAA